MSIELLSLTSKGWAYAKSRQSGTGQGDLWATIYFLGRMNGRTSSDKVVAMVFNGDERAANKAIGELKSKNVIAGE